MWLLAAFASLVALLCHAEPSYLLSSTAYCPSGATLISTKLECQAAAELLKLQATEPIDEVHDEYPAGCFKAAGQLYFNTGGTAASSIEEARAVCAWAEEADQTTTGPDEEEEEEQLGYRGTCRPNAIDVDHQKLPVRELSEVPLAAQLPQSFDARSAWPFCFNESVKAQGSCGSCWAFATSTVVRHRACIYDCHTNQRCDESNALHRRHLSVQHIMGCGTSRAGCDGGWAYQAYDAMKENVAWESDVPYLCGSGQIEDQFTGGSGSCVEWPWGTSPEACSAGRDRINVVGYYQLPLEEAASRADMMAAELVAHGPLAVDFCVRPNLFGFWRTDKARVYTEADGCKHGFIIGGHMAMLIGFGTKEQGGRSVPYWSLQNSWSTRWADEGFFYMERGVNLCGVENKASLPLVHVELDIPAQWNASTSAAISDSTTSEIDLALGESREDSGDFPSWLIWLLVVVAALGFCCCLGACAALLIVLHRDPRGGKSDKRRLLRGDSPVLDAESAPPQFQNAPQQEVPSAPAAKPMEAVLDEPQAAKLPPPGQAEVLGKQLEKVPELAPVGHNPWSRPPAGAPPTRQPPARPDLWWLPRRPAAAAAATSVPAAPAAASAAAAARGSSSRANPFSKPTQAAGGSGTAAAARVEKKEVVPPWWHKEAETYVDNATVRMEAERKKDMY